MKGLTTEQEQNIGRRIEQGDDTARKELIEANTGLVWSEAKKRKTKQLDINDVVGHGYIGLVTAANRWDYRRNIRFSTFATYWIRATISRGIENEDRTIRTPIHALKDTRDLLTKTNTLEARLGREATQCERATETGFTEHYIHILEERRRPIASMDDQFGEHISELLPDNSAIDPESNAIDTVLSEQIRDMVDSLPENEKRVILYRYGINTPVLNRKATAKEIGVQQWKISELEQAALKRMRDQWT